MELVIYLDLHSTKRALWLVDSWSRSPDQIQMCPHRDTMPQLLPSELFVCLYTRTRGKTKLTVSLGTYIKCILFPVKLCKAMLPNPLHFIVYKWKLAILRAISFFGGVFFTYCLANVWRKIKIWDEKICSLTTGYVSRNNRKGHVGSSTSNPLVGLEGCNSETDIYFLSWGCYF